ncbi:PfkB family carbohydrate kinase [Staphylothermus hellenicus]|uniref:Uncharacterized protein n=1 Tax=Staphylothermus hellenicus (strain DSM 12710 / JCM 10830 / BK20S6-10-b1 / P8) TaxID=591019 RepID=D7D8V0_STAHD|nr:PfkB family carbohydrate kinase [Staphylothermus hellenicus]ADI32196.1 hypothetical protein Shell_1093 [Staphylothermus hellenicus DSM 12710]
MKYNIRLYGNFTYDIIVVQRKLLDKRLGGGVYYSSIPFITDSKYNVKIYTVISPIIYYSNKLLRYIAQEQFSTNTNIFKLIYEGPKRTIIVVDRAPQINMYIKNEKADVSIVNPVLGEISTSLLRQIRMVSKIVATDIQGFSRIVNKQNIIVTKRTSDSLDAMNLSNIVHMGLDEAIHITQAKDVNHIAEKLSKISKNTLFIITNSENPPILIFRDKYMIIGSRQKPVQDRTGAGDYFLSVFTKEYMITNDEIESMHHALRETTKWLEIRNASSQPTALKPPPPNP